MTWFKVDDGLAFNAKVVQAGNAAMGMWVRAGSWSAQQLTDGFVPDHIVTTLGTKGQAKALADAGLWAREDGGYRFHGWLEYQPTREHVEKERAAARDRVRKAREAKRSSAGVRANTERTSASVRVTPARPDPTRPKELSVKGGSHVSSDAPAQPPRYPDHCEVHADTAIPGRCGDCKDQRVANQQRPLTVVRETRSCVVHMEPDVTHCRGCAADAKAAS